MATGRERRAERLNERLRGAQRTNVDDEETFNLDLAGLQPVTAPTSGDPFRLPTSPAAPDSLRNAGRAAAEQNRTTGGSGVSERTYLVPPGAAEPDELQSSSPPSSAQANAASRPQRSANVEVTESPANAPGSGRRRDIPTSSVAGSVARLRSFTASDELSEQGSSSPLTRRALQSDVASARRIQGTRQSSLRRSPLSSEQRSVDRSESDPISPEEPTSRNAPPQAKDQEQDQEGAEEIGVVDAARAIGRKRPRMQEARESPELGSQAVAINEQNRTEKRRRSADVRATQKQPNRSDRNEAGQRKIRRVARGDAGASDAGRPKRARKTASTAAGDDSTIEITVQRYVNLKRQQGGDDDGDDPLASEIPFANRSGQTVVDVFAQVCEEVIATVLGQYAEHLQKSTETAKKREFRIKMRAIEAYREELRSRLLEHAIHLDHWYSLGKRVRHAQKEKLALREEILNLKKEREQVALRMDAIRIKHDNDSKEANYCLNASTLMYDIELAVAQGHEAPDLPPKQRKEAELANMEEVLARIVEQVSSASSTGGMLKQVSEFNAFLERAAEALEAT